MMPLAAPRLTRALPLAAALVAALLSFTAGAATAQRAPHRPRLPAAADTNDWEAYYDHAVSKLVVDRGEAEAAMLWAARLDPTRPEPLFGRWTQFWLRDPQRYIRYLDDDEKVLRAADVQLELGLATALEGSDATYRIAYGDALLQARRPADAVEQFRAAMKLEPFHAESYHRLAAGLEAVGDSAGAIAAYREFLTRASRRSQGIASARHRLRALGAPVATP